MGMRAPPRTRPDAGRCSRQRGEGPPLGAGSGPRPDLGTEAERRRDACTTRDKGRGKNQARRRAAGRSTSDTAQSRLTDGALGLGFEGEGFPTLCRILIGAPHDQCAGRFRRHASRRSVPCSPPHGHRRRASQPSFGAADKRTAIDFTTPWTASPPRSARAPCTGPTEHPPNPHIM